MKNDRDAPDAMIEIEYSWPYCDGARAKAAGWPDVYTPPPPTNKINPNVLCPGRPRPDNAYLPLTFEGTVMLEMFKMAFQRRLLFDLGHRNQFNDWGVTWGVHMRSGRIILFAGFL